MAKHLIVLEDAGLVTGRRAGREVLYRISPEPLNESADWLAELAGRWERRLSAIKRAAEEGDR